jgi:hypothetical protein
MRAMGSEYAECIWILSRRYEAVADDLAKPDARRTAEHWISAGFLARIRVYHPQHTPERRYLVYVARPRGMAPSVPFSLPAEA